MGAESTLQKFLAERDVACPLCGYNLRDGSNEQCPECGARLSLSLTAPNDFASRSLLLFVFLWILLAGSMNGTRAWRQAYDVARASAAQPWTPSGFDPDRTVWAAVPTSVWAHAFGWSLLVSVAVTGLSLLWFSRRESGSDRLMRRSQALAWLSFGGYFTYHGCVFVLELL